MLRRFFSLGIVYVAMIVFYTVQAQDIQFSQFYAVPLYQNPAFAGSAHLDRAILHQRLQWPKLDGRYTTSFFSYDRFFRKQKSGFGIMAIQDFQGSANLTSTEVHLQYAYEVLLNSKLTFRPGIQLGLGQKTLNYNNFVFPRNLNDDGLIPNSGAPDINGVKIYPDVAAGMILYSDNAWVGYSGHHLNRPNQSFLGDQIRYPIKHAFTGGYKILMHKHLKLNYQNDDDVQFTLTPTFHYKFQGGSDQLDLGIYSLYDWLLLGVWYRGIPIKKYQKLSYVNNESIIALAGFRLGKWTLGYSYDFTTSKLGGIGKTGGAHEINITFVNVKSNASGGKKRTMKRLPCPDFQRQIIKEDLSH